MRRSQDAFGQALLDRLRGQQAIPVVERDDGNVDADGLAEMYWAEPKRWPAFQRRGLSQVRGRVLDVGCGAGRVALHLQQKGHDVVGVDTSPLAVRVCRERGVKQVRELSITQVDRRLGAFDSIVMYGNNLALLGSPTGGRRLLKRLHGLTREGGRIVGETIDPYQTSEPVHLAYQRRNRRAGRMSGQIRIRVRYRTYATPWFNYLFLSQSELTTLIDGTGWRLGRVYESGGPGYVAVLLKV
jgi:SAM-dependent methyltransferase